MLRNTVARSPNVYTSSAILTAWYRFSRRRRCYGDLVSPAATCSGFRVTCPIILPSFMESLDTFSKMSPASNFDENPSSESRADTCGRTDGHDESNTKTD